MISSSSSFLLLKKSRLRTFSGKISPATRTHSRQLRTTTQKRTKEQKKQPPCCRRRIVFVAASSSYSSSIKKGHHASPLLSLALSLFCAVTRNTVCVWYSCVVLLIRINMWRRDPRFVQKASSFFCRSFWCSFFFALVRRKRGAQPPPKHIFTSLGILLVWNLIHHQHVSVKEKEESCD